MIQADAIGAVQQRRWIESMTNPKLAVAILVPLALYLGFRLGSDYLLLSLLPGGSITAWTVLLSPLPSLTSLLPGFLAGWFCKRALVAGFAVGAIGSAMYSMLVGSGMTYFQDAQAGLLVALFVAQCFTVGLVSAAAGGAAQLVRSNIRSRPTSPRIDS